LRANAGGFAHDCRKRDQATARNGEGHLHEITIQKSRKSATRGSVDASLRHTAVSLLKDAGVPQAVVEELVGHDSEQMSAHYTHVGQAALQKAAAAFPTI
jgi:integrase